MAGNSVAVGYISIVPETSEIAPGISKALGQTDSIVAGHGKKSGGLFSGAFGKAASAAKVAGVAAVGAAAAGSLIGGFKRAMNTQAFESSMTGLLGSAEAAADAVERVGAVAKGSSIDAGAYRDFAQSLAYVGVQGEQSEKVMLNVGKAITGAGGDSSAFDSVTTALTAMSNEGKVTNDRLKQMSNAGLPILDALSTKLGVDIPEVQKMATDGLLDVGDVLEVLEDGTGEWMERLIEAGDEVDKGLGASFKRLKDNVLEGVGKALIPVIDAVAPAVSWAADSIGKLFDSLRGGSAATKWIGPVFGRIRDVVMGQVVPALQTFWSDTVKPVFEDIRDLVTRVWTGTLQPLFEKWWQVISEQVVPTLMTLWQDVVLPAFQEIGQTVKTVWDQNLKPTFERLVDIIENVVAPVVMWLWEHVIGPAFQGIGQAIKIAWIGVIQPTLKAIQAILKVTGTVTSWLYDSVFKPVFAGISGAVELAWGVISPIFGAIQSGMDTVGAVASWLWNEAIVPAWNGIQSAIETVWGFVSPIFDKLGAAFETVGTIAGSVVDGIKSGFSGLKGVITAPLNALGRVLQKVPKSIFGFDIPGASSVREWGDTLAALRDGGIVPAGRTAAGRFFGPGTGVSDSLIGVDGTGTAIVRVSAGEGVVNKRAMDAGWDRMVAAANRGLPALAGGGTIGGREPYGLPVGTQISYGASGFPQWVRDLEERFGLQASTYPGHQERSGQNKGIDWSGPVDRMHEFAVHLAGMPEQLEQLIWMHPSTGEQIGVADGVHVGPGTDQPGYYRNDWSGHTDHVHTRQSYAIGIDAAPVSVVAADPVEVVAEVDNTQVSTEPTTSGGERVTVQGIAGQIAKDAAEESVGELLSIFGLENLSLPDLSRAEPAAESAPAAVAEVSVDGDDLVIAADPAPRSVREIVRGIFAASGWGDGSQWDAADNIITRESSWDPLAQNPSSTAFGLFQFLDDTWATVGATKTEDPEEQAVAGAAYMGQRYGDPIAAWDFWQKNNWYDAGGLAHGIGLLQKNTLEPERVLSPAQTAAFEQLIPMLTDAGVAAIGGAVTAIAPEAAPIAAAVAPAVGGAIKGGLGSLTDALSEGAGGGYGEVTINIDGAQDPEAVAAAVQRVLRDPRRAGAGHTVL